MSLLRLKLRTLIPLAVVGIFLPIGMAIIGMTYFESISDLELNSKAEFKRQLSELSLRLDHIGADGNLSEAQQLLSTAGAADGVVHLSLVGTDQQVIASTRYEWIGKEMASVWGRFDQNIFQGLFHGSNRELIPYEASASFHAYHFTKLRAPSGKNIRSITQAALVGEYNYKKALLTLEKRLRQKAALYFIALLLSAGLISYLLIRFVSAPVERLSEFVASFDDDSFGREVEVSGPFEMRTLTLAINRMSKTLQSSNEQIQEEIRERKQTEETLLRFRTALDSSADSVYVIDPESMKFLDMNRTAYESLGYSKNELLNMGPQDIKPLISDSELTEIIEKTLNEAGTRKLETIHARKDGSRFPVEVFLRPLMDGEKRIIIASVRDVSERKASEEMLRKLSQAIEQAGEAVLITNANAVIEYVNPAFTKITGHTLEDAIGKTPAILNSTAQGETFYKELWDVISHGEVWHGGLTEKRKDGTFYPAMMSIAPIHDEAGNITHYVSIQQDMTEYKRLEAQFLQSQKMESIGTLVGGIAHDFNNMLAGIMGNAYLAKRRADGDPQLLENIDTINTLSVRAADMIKQLLTFARKDRVEMEPLLLNTFLEEGGRLAQTGIPENIEFVVDICPEELLVSGDATQLQQIIMNLANNARDALIASPQPQISCSLKRFVATDSFREAHPELKANAYALLTVRDNGPGIKHDHLKKIFDPFFTTKSVDKGTGLGLAMVYGSVQTHGGAIEVESRIGDGAAFHIYLPLINVFVASGQKEAAVIHGQEETILLVDDEECMRLATSEVLRSLNYNVLEATDGEEALAAFKAHKDEIDLVLTDIVMPRLGGIELATSIRALDGTVPIIFATGYDKEQTLSSDLKINQSIIISKPFTYEYLSQLIAPMINRG